MVRLLVLWSLVNSGLKPKVFDEARASVTQFFGLPTLLLLHNLQKLGGRVVARADAQGCWCRARRRATSRRCGRACGWCRTAWTG